MLKVVYASGVDNQNKADFGNTIVSQKEEPKQQNTIRAHAMDYESGTIVL